MFHANCWSLCFTAPLSGAALVMPGAKLDGASLHELIETEGVTCSAGVPTIWLMLLDYLEKDASRRLDGLKRVNDTEGHAAGDAALMALLAEWMRTGPNSSYAERVSNLNNGGGLNGGMTLNSGTVFLEGSIDSLTGDGGLDWYWIRLGQDVISDLESGEQTNGS